MQFCPNCGRKLDDDTTFCSECGFDIKNYKNSDNDCFLITVKFESKSWLNEMSKDALYS